MWHLGSTFLGNVIEKPYEHLHIVLSDPYDSKDKKVVVVTFMSTFNGESNSEEDCCIIEAGEHPFAKSRSYLVYNDCAEISVDSLNKKLQEGSIKLEDNLSQELIERAIEGVLKSKLAGRKFKNIARKIQYNLTK